MALPTNILQTVQTYQNSGLGLLTNLNCFMSTANMKFKDFNKLEGNLGDTVTFDLPPRYAIGDTLVATFQASTQRVQPLTVNRAKNVAFEFSAQQFILNVEDYMAKFGESAVAELGAYIEADIASVIPEHTYRFYGSTSSAMSSYQELAQALSFFRSYGAVKNNTRGYLPNTNVPAIIGSGLSQFATNRNNEIANSWELGAFSMTEWYQSNLLPVHTAGVAGQEQDTLTFVSINAAGTEITFSGAGTDTGYFKAGDLLYFLSDVRYLTFVGHKPSPNPVQVRITADADSSGGTVVASIYPALIYAPTLGTPGAAESNLTRALTTSDTAKVLNSHRCGLITSGDPLYVAMPKLPETVPFPSHSEIDPDTGVSLRMYYGELFGQNERGVVYDAIWGRTMADNYAMRLIFPV